MEKMKKDLSSKSYLNPNPGMLDVIKVLFPSYLILDSLTSKERVRGLDPGELAGFLNPEERVRGLEPGELAKCFNPKAREEFVGFLNPEDRLKGLDRKTIEAYLSSMS